MGSRVEPGIVRLTDYLQVATLEGSSLELQVRLGAIACGKIAIRSGSVIHAELPGASGEQALVLLARIPNARFEVTSLAAMATTIERPWSDILGVSLALASEGDSGRRHLDVYARLRERGLGPRLGGIADAAPLPRQASLQAQRATRSAALLLRRAGLVAYLAGDLERARRCYERVLAVRPHDLESRTNVERIRARQLIEQQLGRLEVSACD
jgi:hypothetical protein